MYRRDPDGEIQGVLTGWDLAIWNSDSSGIPQLPTGPTAFTAYQLAPRVNPYSQRKEAKPATLYRHAAESFIWVLLYISLKDSSCSSELERWHDLHQSHYSRVSLILSRSDSGEYIPTESHAPLFKYAARLLGQFWFRVVEQLHIIRTERTEIPDEEVGKVFMTYVATMDSGSTDEL
jgi:hypothetical protein